MAKAYLGSCSAIKSTWCANASAHHLLLSFACRGMRAHSCGSNPLNKCQGVTIMGNVVLNIRKACASGMLYVILVKIQEQSRAESGSPRNGCVRHRLWTLVVTPLQNVIWGVMDAGR
eukprot:297632-Chlamydomonas_euryale.AAC.1